MKTYIHHHIIFPQSFFFLIYFKASTFMVVCSNIKEETSENKKDTANLF